MAHGLSFCPTTNRSGNHETLNMNKVYGFEGEVKHKYSQQMFQLFTEVFHELPLAYCLGKKVLVVHGGLFSRDDVTLDDIRKIDRRREPPDEGLMSEILWSDPQPMPGRAPSKRGVGLSFGPDVTAKFLERNDLKLVVRSHEVKDAGYEIEADGKLITVFSAPNYCDQVSWLCQPEFSSHNLALIVLVALALAHSPPMPRDHGLAHPSTDGQQGRATAIRFGS